MVFNEKRSRIEQNVKETIFDADEIDINKH